MDRTSGRGCAFEHTEFSQRRGDRGEWNGRGHGGPGGDRGDWGGRCRGESGGGRGEWGGKGRGESGGGRGEWNGRGHGGPGGGRGEWNGRGRGESGGGRGEWNGRSRGESGGGRGEWDGKGRGGPGGDRGGREYRSNDDLLEGIFEKAPDAQLLFVGSVNCLRHRPYAGIGKLMQAGRASILSPSMTDFSTGRYLRQVTDAIVELSQERNCKRFILSFGCQWVILSTDGEMIRQELMNEHGIELIFHDDSHLEFGDHQ